MLRLKTPWMVCAALAALLTIAGCNNRADQETLPNKTESAEATSTDATSAAAPAGTPSQLGGSLSILGSSTVYPLSEAILSTFTQSFPKVEVNAAGSGTGAGFKRFTKGEIEISAASRPIKLDEFKACAEGKIAFIELPVAYDGLTVVVNPENTWVEQLSVEDLQKIFLEGQAAKTWKDVKPEWPDEPIKIFAPGTDSGTFDYFREVVVGSDESKAIRSDMSTNEDDSFLVNGVAGDKNSIGFFGAAYYYENESKLKAVKIVSPSGEAVLPTPEAIESGAYAPFSRPLLIYVSLDSLKRPEVRKFVEYYLEQAPKVAAQVGYVPLPAAVYDLARDHVRNRMTGTHFMLETGEKRPGNLVETYSGEKRLELDGLKDPGQA